ncbi:MAG TPA: alpha/beta hydrolase [Steroidobacteraceae bacterium]|nr:alpha/beta hydrolase [Steroidobacteraceae bacterium]
MADLDRRSFLLLGSASALISAAPAARARTPNASLVALPDAWMHAEVLRLWPGSAPGDVRFVPQPEQADWPPVYVRNVAAPELRIFRPKSSNGGAVLVIPGGGYQFVSVGNEGVDIAAQLTALGFTVFVLVYRLPDEGWRDRADVPLQDARRAMRLVRSRAKEFGIHADEIAALGFSAGGHLAASLTTGHKLQTYDALDAVDRLSAQPFAAGLIYPVLTMTRRWTHSGSRERLLGPDPSEALIAAHSTELQVDAETPPCFLAHAADDEAVPVENSLAFLDAMRKAKRPVEAHIFQEGNHAFGIGRPGTPSAQWIELFSLWLQRLKTARAQLA